ncbi:MAG: prepilin-type cleavage/methylation domain-containing protein [Gammaproteobacteria bacterium]|nr:MAG: prepilin-type cleavage/methylation domain-containing protein [Gammaproteobacteria bacterium]
MVGRLKGFTLVELMIVVAIIGILGAIAYPSYQSYVMRSKRTIAKIVLADIVEQQTKYYIENRTYGDLSDLGYANDTIGINSDGDTVASGSGNYDLSTTAATTTTFTIQAVAKNIQTGDTARGTSCTPLTINHLGARTPSDCW